MLIALDFGRAYVGWVALNNAARVGADYAGRHADAWGPHGRASDRTTYENTVFEARVRGELDTLGLRQ